MTLRQKNLVQILQQEFTPADEPLIFSKEIFKNPKWYKKLEAVYQALGGGYQIDLIRPDKFIFQSEKWAVALDEPVHFNKYRNQTLRNDFYETCPWPDKDKYRLYCRKNEKECMKMGSVAGIWTNREAEAHFGPSEEPGDLGLNGSSGWKLIAFKDFMLDLVTYSKSMQLIRLSVYDEILYDRTLLKLGDLLLSPDEQGTELITKFISRKILPMSD